MGFNAKIGTLLAELWDFKHRRHFIISFHHPSPLPPTLVTIAYVRIMRTSLTPGEEGGDQGEDLPVKPRHTLYVKHKLH